MSQNDREARSWLPLSPLVLHVLLALSDGDKHGYAIIKEVRHRTRGDIEIGASSLYTVLRRLLEGGLVAETDERPHPALDDERRRYYTLTRLGRDVTVEEIKRLQSVIAQARDKRLITKKGIA